MFLRLRPFWRIDTSLKTKTTQQGDDYSAGKVVEKMAQI